MSDPDVNGCTVDDFHPQEDTSPQICKSCGGVFPRNTFRRVIIAGVRRQRCDTCADVPRKPAVCPECCDMSWRRPRSECRKCTLPYAAEQNAGLDHDRSLPSALAMVMR